MTLRALSVRPYVQAGAMERSAAKLRSGARDALPLNYVGRRGDPETLHVIAAFLTQAYGRGLHSSTLQLSAFCVTGGAVRGRFGVV
jgi:hypothetical protein